MISFSLDQLFISENPDYWFSLDGFKLVFFVVEFGFDSIIKSDVSWLSDQVLSVDSFEIQEFFFDAFILSFLASFILCLSITVDEKSLWIIDDVGASSNYVKVGTNGVGSEIIEAVVHVYFSQILVLDNKVVNRVKSDFLNEKSIGIDCEVPGGNSDWQNVFHTDIEVENKKNYIPAILVVCLF